MLAYLDASSGSMLVGAVAAAGAGVAVAAKVGWRRVTGKLTGKKADAESGTDAEESGAQTETSENSAPVATSDDA